MLEDAPPSGSLLRARQGQQGLKALDIPCAAAWLAAFAPTGRQPGHDSSAAGSACAQRSPLGQEGRQRHPWKCSERAGVPPSATQRGRAGRTRSKAIRTQRASRVWEPGSMRISHACTTHCARSTAITRPSTCGRARAPEPVRTRLARRFLGPWCSP